MSLTRKELEEIYNRCKTLERLAGKVWRKGHYKWGNDINWEALMIKKLITNIIGQME
jgi:hypothetical protein